MRTILITLMLAVASATTAQEPAGDAPPEYDAEAISELRRAAEQGDAHAQYNLGLAYWDGEGVRRDHAEAVAWWRRAASRATRAEQRGDLDGVARGDRVVGRRGQPPGPAGAGAGPA